MNRCLYCGKEIKEKNGLGRDVMYCCQDHGNKYRRKVKRGYEIEQIEVRSRPEATEKKFREGSLRVVSAPAESDFKPGARFDAMSGKMAVMAGYFEPGTVLEYNRRRGMVIGKGLMEVRGERVSAGLFFDHGRQLSDIAEES